MNSRIKQIAAAMGFDVCGITSVAALKPGEEALAQWVGEGKHGEMKYLEDFQARREKFFGKIPDAKSVIVLGVNYFSHLSSPARPGTQSIALGSRFRGNDNVPKGRIARYAWGRDYHEIIRQKHLEFIEELKREIGSGLRAESCVDIQPVPERHAAFSAGLGFAGKNTMLLSRQFGPWLFLSEIVTNLEIPEDPPAEGDCGTCAKCQQICPTGALDEDYAIDARKCIAYLTIEYKGIIPAELRPQIKDWVFGCDACLTICPFTSHEKESTWPELKPEAGNGPWMDWDALFSLKSNREYEEKFAGTALLRAGRKQMLRNACIVLGNSGRPEALPYLFQALQDPAPLVRLHAAWGIGQIGGETAVNMLIEQLGREPDAGVIEEVRRSLAALGMTR